MDREVRSGTARRRPQSVVGSPPRPTDEELMERFRGGEASAFDELLDRHKRPVYGFLLRQQVHPNDVDDLFQEVFVKVLRAAPSWQPTARFTTWLYTVARNACIDHGRRRRTQPRMASVDGSDGDRTSAIDRAPDRRPDPEQSAIEGQLDGLLQGLIDALPDPQREAFELKRQGLTFEAIGEIVGASSNTVKSRLRYALERLRNGLSQEHLGDVGGKETGR